MAELQRDAERNVHVWIVRVTQVVHTVNFDHINVLRVQPIARPDRLEPEPIAAVLEAVIAVIAFADAKAMFASEIGLVTVGGNAATSSVLLLLLGLALLLRVFLFWLAVLLFPNIVLFWLDVFLLLSAFLLWLYGFFWLRLLLFFLRRLVLVFFLLFVLFLLCVCRNTNSEGQRENCCADGSNEFHEVLPPLSNSYLIVDVLHASCDSLTGLAIASPDPRCPQPFPT